MLKKQLILLCIFIASATLFAGQSKVVKHTETVNVNLSSIDPNIITVLNDRVSRVSVIKGVANISVDNKYGEINIKPSGGSSTKPFSMIISTEKGNRYTVIAVPKKIPAQDVVLKNPSVRAYSNNASNSSYIKEISLLIKNMIHGRDNKDYKKENVEVKNKENSSNPRLVTIYKGDIYDGEVYEYQNDTNKDIKINEQKFYKNNVVAVSVSKGNLKPGQKTKIYKVVSHG